ncbi:MAG: ABC-ATPase domain-containing protein [Bacillota bacterium]|nr:ABC-ATPase domain-containing protein [Bacillota bacterium]
MFSSNDLKQKLNRIDGRGYKAYKDIEGSFQCGGYVLFIDHVQADPFAPASRMRVRMSMAEAGFPAWMTSDTYITALEDVIAQRTAVHLSGVRRRTTKGAPVFIDAGGQEVLVRTAVKVETGFVELRLSVNLPAGGRRILAMEAQDILLNDIAGAAESMRFQNYSEEELKSSLYLYEDQEYIRGLLGERNLVSFIANGSVLPRKSGVSSLPMAKNEAITFVSPAELEVEIPTKHHGILKGMGVPEGVTLIVGGGYHGKTTLLKAIERGVYNHRNGDGREFVISVSDAVKIRAEDGRSVVGVNISPFIDNLPTGDDARRFSTTNASGSTSQAANIVEGIEAGARVLLLDEDSCATNFMIRDARMQRLVSADREPITPFIDRVSFLFKQQGVSSILVIGGAGDYLDVADHVIMMDRFLPADVTEQARQVAAEIPNKRNIEENGNISIENRRILHAKSVQMVQSRKVVAKGLSTILFGDESIDLSAIDQLVDASQTRAIAEMMRYMARGIDGKRCLGELLDMIYSEVGLDPGVLSVFGFDKHPGDLALPRRLEVAAAVNRLRNLKIE